MDINEKTFSLLIENALLEQEKRLSAQFRVEMNSQTDRFTRIVDNHNTSVSAITQKLVELSVKVDALKIRIWAVGAICTTTGGFLGFFLSKVI